MKKHNVKKRRKTVSLRTRNWITVACVVAGIAAGFFLWLFVTRCDHKSCILHNVPLREVLVFGFAGLIFPVALLNVRKK